MRWWLAPEGRAHDIRVRCRLRACLDRVCGERRPARTRVRAGVPGRAKEEAQGHRSREPCLSPSDPGVDALPPHRQQDGGRDRYHKLDLFPKTTSETTNGTARTREGAPPASRGRWNAPIFAPASLRFGILPRCNGKRMIDRHVRPIKARQRQHPRRHRRSSLGSPLWNLGPPGSSPVTRWGAIPGIREEKRRMGETGVGDDETGRKILREAGEPAPRSPQLLALFWQRAC